MGDILGAIFGTSSATNQQTSPDPVTQAMNLEKYKQLLGLLSTGGLFPYTQPATDIYTPTAFSTDLTSIARNEALAPRNNLDFVQIPTLDQYLKSFDPVTQSYNTAQGNLNATTAAGLEGNAANYATALGGIQGNVTNALNRSYGDYTTGANAIQSKYSNVITDLNNEYNQAIARGDYDYARALIQSERNRQQSLSTLGNTFSGSLGLEEAARQRAIAEGTNTLSGFASRIATPAANRAATLQGLEYGGAVPQAIATAVAGQATPYLQSIEQLYGANVANLVAQYIQGQTGINTATQQTQAGIGTAQAATNAQLAQQLMTGQTSAGNVMQQNIAQLAQALMANNITLEQAGISASSALGQQLIQAQNSLRLQQQQGGVALANTYTPLQAAFAQSIPGVGASLAALPGQLSAQRINTLTAMQPLADQQRALAEQDFLRRQGLFQTVYTGIPYQPGSSTQQTSGTGNIFNQLGGLISSAGTFGEKGGSGQGIAS